MNNSLVDDIMEYVEDHDTRYAIALEGDWCSGKTRFCETALKAALENKGYTMLRVSLLGIDGVDGMYERLAMMLVHLGARESDNNGRRLAKELGSLLIQGGISFGKKVLADQGVMVEATPRILASVLGEKQLLIIDDFERSGFFNTQTASGGARATDQKAIELFGAINSLIDGQGCKVMFVTNDFAGISVDIKEKLIWKCLQFDPSPKDLAKEIILPKLSYYSMLCGFDVIECVCRASEDVSCANARAMIKATKLLGMAFGSNVARDSAIDKSNRWAALCDFTRYSLLAAMGRAPEHPGEPQAGARFDLKRANAIVAYTKYSQLGVIESFFNAQKSVEAEDVNACLAQYVASRYAGTPETMRVRRLLESLRNVQCMEDDEDAKHAAELSRCVMGTEFDLSYLGEAVRTNWTLRNWGFQETIPTDKLLERSKELVNANPEGAYKGIHGEYLHWSDEWRGRYDGLMEKIDAYAVDAYSRTKNEEFMRNISPDKPDAGTRIADAITDGWGRGEDLFLDFGPALVVSCFISGDAGSQIALYHMIENMGDRAVLYKDERALRWVESLLDEMRSAEPKSRMGSKRQSWTIEALEKLNRSHTGQMS